MGLMSVWKCLFSQQGEIFLPLRRNNICDILNPISLQKIRIEMTLVIHRNDFALTLVILNKIFRRHHMRVFSAKNAPPASKISFGGGDLEESRTFSSTYCSWEKSHFLKGSETICKISAFFAEKLLHRPHGRRP